MHSQPIADPATADGTYDALILDLLLTEHDGLWSTSELEQMLGDPIAVADSLNRLHALALIHRLDEFVFATRAAAHVHKLAS